MSDQIINRYSLTNDALIRQAERINGVQTGSTAKVNVPQGENSFRQLLDQTIAGHEVSFSKHANIRAAQRSINIGGMEIERLTEACKKADQKGIRDALIVMDDSAFIMNTANRVVITVMDKNEMKENIFTNIDGALFI